MAGLGPAGETRLDQVTRAVAPRLLTKLLVEQRHIRARSHHAHVTAEHIPELGKLIETPPAQKSAERKNALVLAL